MESSTPITPSPAAGRVTSTGGVTGQITDPAGNALANATIIINGASALTDSSGLYRFHNLAAGLYPVTVSAQAYATQSLSVTIPAGADATFPVSMGAAYGSFTGTVTDHSSAVAGAVVQALSGGLIVGSAVSDAGGRYVLWVPGGSGYTLQASQIQRSTTAISALTVAAGTVTNVNLSLPSTLAAITGLAQNASLQPLAGAQVSIASPTFNAIVATDANGKYTASGVPAGTYSVSAAAAGYTAATQTG